MYGRSRIEDTTDDWASLSGPEESKLLGFPFLRVGACWGHEALGGGLGEAVEKCAPRPGREVQGGRSIKKPRLRRRQTGAGSRKPEAGSRQAAPSSHSRQEFPPREPLPLGPLLGPPPPTGRLLSGLCLSGLLLQPASSSNRPPPFQCPFRAVAQPDRLARGGQKGGVSPGSAPVARYSFLVSSLCPRT